MTVYYIPSHGPDPKSIAMTLAWMVGKGMTAAMLYIPIKKNVDNYRQYLNPAVIDGLNRLGRASANGIVLTLATKSTIQSMDRTSTVLALHCSDGDLSTIIAINPQRDVIWIPWAPIEFERAKTQHTLVAI